MRVDIDWQGETTAVDLVPGVVFVGGGPRDGIRLEGLAPSLVMLHVGELDLKVTARCPLRVGGVPFPPHVARLVLPGESVQVSEALRLGRWVDSARVERRGDVSTAFVAKSLLAEGAPELDTRAASLTGVTGLDAGTVFLLGRSENLIGREVGCAVQLRERTVSRRHALVRITNSVYSVEPLSLRNGVYVNGRRVVSTRVLRDGDVLECGRTQLRFQAAASRGLSESVLPEVAPVVPALVVGAPNPIKPVEAAPALEQGPRFELIALVGGAIAAAIGLAALVGAMW